MNMNTPTHHKLTRIGNLSRCVGIFATFVLTCTIASQAADLYWTGGTGDWTTATSSTPWAATSGGPTDTPWSNGSNAIIESVSPEIQTWNVSAGTVTVQNGVTLYASGTTSTGRGLSIGTGGSGDITLRDDRTQGGTSLRLFLNGTTPWDGTLTVNGSETSTVALTINGNISGGTNMTGTQTKVHLASGGLLEMGSGTANGTVTIGELSGNGIWKFQGQYSVTGGTRTLKVDQATNTTFSGTLGENVLRSDHILAFTKAGTGTLAISGNGGYTGATTVEGGKLYFDGTYGTGFSGVSGQGNYLVGDGALLGVNGTITLSTTALSNVTIQDGGILQAGTANSTGTMTLAGGDGTSTGLVFAGQATIQFRLGTDQDNIVLSSASMTGAASGGAESIAFTFTNTGGIVIGETYDLISFGGTEQGIALSSFTLSEDSSLAGWDGTFSYGGDGNLLQFTVSAIPEPSTVGALLAGLGGLAVFIGRRRYQRR